jgi:hypothetical protein
MRVEKLFACWAALMAEMKVGLMVVWLADKLVAL